jgi:cell division protein FtsZ
MNEVIPINWDSKLRYEIKIIGVGGGGNNAVKNMYEKGIEGVDFIICNTDAQALQKSPVPNKIQLGAKLTRGLGAGCDPEIGRLAAEENIDEIKQILGDNEQTKMVFIATGLGGGTGTGASPVIAKISKDMGILTVAIVTLPFLDEGDEPYKRAIKGLKELMENVDSLLIIKSEKLYDIYSDLSIFEAFPKADDIVATAAKSIAEIITVEGYINVDFADVKTVMKDSKTALMGHGRAAGENRVQSAVEQALKSPLLNDIDISNAKNVLVNVSSGLKRPMKVSELRNLMDYINKESGRGANFKRGVMQNVLLDAENSDAEITVTIIATGFSMEVAYPDVYDDIQNLLNPQLEAESEDTIITENGVEIPYTDYTNTDKVLYPNSSSDVPEIAEPVGHVGEESVNSYAAWSPSSPVNKSSGGIVNTWGAMKEADITMIEQIPAFERLNTKIAVGKSTTKEVAMHRLDESDGNHILGENNSYLDRDVD